MLYRSTHLLSSNINTFVKFTQINSLNKSVAFLKEKVRFWKHFLMWTLWLNHLYTIDFDSPCTDLVLMSSQFSP